jgi:hypothetical protein
MCHFDRIDCDYTNLKPEFYAIAGYSREILGHREIAMEVRSRVKVPLSPSRIVSMLVINQEFPSISEKTGDCYPAPHRRIVPRID